MATTWTRSHNRKSTTRKIRRKGGTSYVRVKASSVKGYRRKK
jgi:hypothetical protein